MTRTCGACIHDLSQCFFLLHHRREKNSGIKNSCPSKILVSHSRESTTFLSAVNCWALNTFAFWIWDPIKQATFAPFCFLLPTGLNNSRSQLAWAIKWRLQARVWCNMHPRSVYTCALPGGRILRSHSKVQQTHTHIHIATHIPYALDIVMQHVGLQRKLLFGQYIVMQVSYGKK